MSTFNSFNSNPVCCHSFGEFVQSDPEGLRSKDAGTAAGMFGRDTMAPQPFVGVAPFLSRPPTLSNPYFTLNNYSFAPAGPFPTVPPLLPPTHLFPSAHSTQPNSPKTQRVKLPPFQCDMSGAWVPNAVQDGHSALPYPPRLGGIARVGKGGTMGWRVVETKPMMAMKIDFTKEDFLIGGEPLYLSPDYPTVPSETGLRVWDAGIVMAKMLDHFGLSDILLPVTKEHIQCSSQSHIRILELGCGTAIGGIAAAMLGGHVVCSDKSVLKDRTINNIQLNAENIDSSGGQCQFMELDWNYIERSDVSIGQHDLILASDVIWSDIFVDPFVAALKKTASKHTTVLISQKARSEELEKLFSKKLEEYFEVVERIASNDVLLKDFQNDKIYVLKARLK